MSDHVAVFEKPHCQLVYENWNSENSKSRIIKLQAMKARIMNLQAMKTSIEDIKKLLYKN